MATGARMADELAELVGPALRALGRVRARIVVGIGVVITMVCAFALVGAAVDDMKISAHQATAQAEVLDGSTFFRTLVRFRATDGEILVPELGVAYPRGLTPGETVQVDYDLADRGLVRVAGRNALTSGWPLLVAIVLTWAVCWPVARRLRRPTMGGAP